MKYHFASKNIEEANRLVLKYHYSRRIPGNIQFVGTWHKDGGLFGDLGECVAACYFSSPPTRWSLPVLELIRLVRKDEIQCPLTGLISQCVKALKKKKIANLLVSFADSTQGHHGGIYQAASWNYHGLREKSMDGLIINGTFVPGRTCNAVYGTRSPGKLKTLKPAWDIKPHYDAGKHLYWIALNKEGELSSKQLNLMKNPYPKPQKNAN